MRIDLIKKGNYIKANLNCHTTLSDGTKTPMEIKQMYREHGYGVVAFTDKDVFVNHNDLTDDEFLALNGFEISAEQYENGPMHSINFISANPNLKDTDLGDAPDYSVNSINDYIERANKQGFLACYNHPMYSMQNFDSVLPIKGLWAFEINNYSKGIHEDNNHLYDRLSRAGRRIFAVATDGNRNEQPDDSPLSDSFGSYTLIKSDKNDYESIINALRNGDFYATSGPRFEEIYIEDGFVHIKCTPAYEVRMLSIGRDAHIARVKDGIIASTLTGTAPIDYSDPKNHADCVTEAVFKIDGLCEKFIRFDIRGLDGTFADTRTFFSDELGLEF